MGGGEKGRVLFWGVSWVEKTQKKKDDNNREKENVLWVRNPKVRPKYWVLTKRLKKDIDRNVIGVLKKIGEAGQRRWT